MLRKPCERQLSLFDEPIEESGKEELSVEEDSPEITVDEVKDGLDELFSLAGQYRNGDDYLRLMKFVRGFRFYSPFNAMLIYTQRPGATYVATPKRWLDRYGYNVKTSATPITILRPMGPVMFVFDVSDLEPGPRPRQLPDAVYDPFRVYKGSVDGQLDMTIENAKRDGIEVSKQLAGSQLAGSIRPSTKVGKVKAIKTTKPEIEYEEVSRRYEMLLSTHLSKEARYATLVHELGHLYCGHLGSPNKKWWPDRRRHSRSEEEFEAESVSYLVCGRLGINTGADEYLSGYLHKSNGVVPEISFDTILRSVTLIEKMGQGYLPLRKEKD